MVGSDKQLPRQGRLEGVNSAIHLLEMPVVAGCFNIQLGTRPGWSVRYQYSSISLMVNINVPCLYTTKYQFKVFVC